MSEDDPTKELPDEQPSKDEMKVVNFADFANEVLSRLSSLEQKVDERMRETRPIWEKALAEISETRQEMNVKFRALDRKFDQVARDLFEMRTDVSDLNSRVSDLERRQS